MSEKKVKVTYNKLEVKEFPIGTSLKQISKSFQNKKVSQNKCG